MTDHISPFTVVQKMRSIIEDNDLEVMATVARYISSYAKTAKPAWWMKSKDCGPVFVNILFCARDE